MKVSVIIPTYNKAQWLELTLFSLKKYGSESDFEIIIVDDGSTDNTKGMVDKYSDNLNIKYIYQKNQGISVARNNAIKNSNGDLLLFIDDDRVVGNSFIKNHIQFHCNNDEKIAAVGERYQLFISNIDLKKDEIKKEIDNGFLLYKRLLKKDRYFEVVSKVFNDDKYKKIKWIACTFSNLSIKKSVLDEIGYFDEKFNGWGCEDIELAYRLIKSGCDIKMVDAVNYHIEHLRNSNIPKEFIRNYNYMYSKHPDDSVKYYLDFEQGRISIEKYAALINGDYMLECENETYFIDNNTFRTKGLK